MMMVTGIVKASNGNGSLADLRIADAVNGALLSFFPFFFVPRVL